LFYFLFLNFSYLRQKAEETVDDKTKQSLFLAEFTGFPPSEWMQTLGEEDLGEVEADENTWVRQQQLQRTLASTFPSVSPDYLMVGLLAVFSFSSLSQLIPLQELIKTMTEVELYKLVLDTFVHPNQVIMFVKDLDYR
jgi:hypothetical protein